MKQNIKGLLLTAAISLISILLNRYSIHFIETLTIGIILGLLVANTFNLSKDFKPGISFSLKKILKWGIVLLGVKLNFSLLISLGPKILGLILFLITVALTGAYLLGKLGHLSKKLSVLLGVGSSICGASAIVAMGPVIHADDEDVAISVTVISLLGAIGVILYSFAGKYLPLTDLQYGIWSGSSLQGVAHALAAAGARGPENVSLEIGTIVKMARVAMLGPVAVILGLIFSTDTNAKGANRHHVHFPKYVLYFIILGLLSTLNTSFHLLPTTFTAFNYSFDIIEWLKSFSNFFILMAMVAMGLSVNLKSFEKKAVKALIVCSLVFIILSSLSLVAVHWIA